MAREEEKLKLGKGAAFVKGRFKRLRREDVSWEADLQALPKPVTPSGLEGQPDEWLEPRG